MLSRDQIIKAKPRTREINIPAWGDSIVLRAYTLNSRMALLNAISDNNKAVDDYEMDQAKPEAERVGVPKAVTLEQPILAVLFSAVDENDELLFTLDDYDAVAALDYNITLSLWRAVMELNEVIPIDERLASKKKPSAKTRNGVSRSASRYR